jgi:hypothetical protein
MCVYETVVLILQVGYKNGADRREGKHRIRARQCLASGRPTGNVALVGVVLSIRDQFPKRVVRIVGKSLPG